MSTQKGTLINKYTPNYVIFDLETTGISPNYDEVIEISALKVKGGEVVDEFNTLVNPGRKIPFGATKVNGITNAMVAEAPAFSHVLAEFLDFAEGLVLVGHNIARFDMKFIWRDAEQYFGRHQLVENALAPFKVTDTAGQFDVIALCDGGGISGQSGALRLGIARALLNAGDYRADLKKAGFLTRDARVVERKKYGLKKARRAPQFSKR